MSLRSKADLQITKNKLAEVQNDIKTLSRFIADKNIQLDKQRENIQKLNIEWTQKRAEIENKDIIINSREKNILHLKKKT